MEFIVFIYFERGERNSYEVSFCFMEMFAITEKLTFARKSQIFDKFATQENIEFIRFFLDK